MPAKGWIAVRNLVGTGKEDLKDVLDKFKKEFRICPDCDGVGHTVDKHETCFEGVSSIKISDHAGLKEMREDGTLTKDVLNRVLETMMHNRETCGSCNGLGFQQKERFVKKKSRKKKHGLKKVS